VLLWFYLLSFDKRCMNIWCVLRDLICWFMHIFDWPSNFYSDTGFENSWCTVISHTGDILSESSTWSLRVHFWFIVACVMTCGALMWAIHHSSYVAAGVVFFVEWIFLCLCKKITWWFDLAKQGLIRDKNSVFYWMFCRYHLNYVIVQYKIREKL
jgi:hypothetical protein